MEKVVFLTGATGFVGGNILLRLLEDDSITNIILLVRANHGASAEDRLYRHLKKICSGNNLPASTVKIKVVTGDVAIPYLGLQKEHYNQLAKTVTHIIHSAANVSFTQTLDEARKVNCFGTDNVLKFAQHAKANLKRFCYIGTAYVSGSRSGKILEDELIQPSGFANSYEQSKFETEKLVRSYFKHLPVTIFKPSIIIGDSQTGITSVFNVLYYPLRLIYKGYLQAIPGSKNNFLDVVPVDYVADAISYILFHTENSTGKVYHLTNGAEAATTGEIVSLAMKYFNEHSKSANVGKIIFIPEIIFNVSKRFYSHTIKKLIKNLEVFIPYLLIKRMFDNSNTARALQGSGIIPPRFNEYYRAVLGYCLYANWGKNFKAAA